MNSKRDITSPSYQKSRVAQTLFKKIFDNILFCPQSLNTISVNANHGPRVGAGMVNLGNSCYLNSGLQALFHIPSVSKHLLKRGSQMSYCSEVSCINCSLVKTYMASLTNSVFAPNLIWRNLRKLSRGKLTPYHQEDAHEFIRYELFN